MTDIVDELRAACLAFHQTSPRPEGPTDEELRLLAADLRWQAADEIERLRQATSLAWQPMSTAPKDERVLLYCPGLAGNVENEVVIGMWRFDPNRRSLGYWVSDVGALDGGFAETGPWIEYPELKPERWAPLLASPHPGP
jgi:hypothetical protein